MGFSKLLNSVGGVINSLVGQDIVARSISLTQATTLNAITLVTGARLNFGGASLAYLSGDGSNTITAPGIFQVALQLKLGTNANLAVNNQAIFNTAPTVTAGAGAAIVSANGTIGFRVDLGGAAQTGTITLPTAVNGWVLYGQNITAPASNVIGQTGGTTTTATFTNYARTTGLAANWAANDNALFIAIGY